MVALVIALALGFVAGRSWLDAVDGHAGLTLGPLRYSRTVGTKGGVHHSLHCGHLRFATSPEVSDAIEADVPYRVYYGAHSHHLLSLERADTGS